MEKNLRIKTLPKHPQTLLTYFLNLINFGLIRNKVCVRQLYLFILRFFSIKNLLKPSSIFQLLITFASDKRNQNRKGINGYGEYINFK
jgi:hypothetical protein